MPIHQGFSLLLSYSLGSPYCHSVIIHPSIRIYLIFGPPFVLYPSATSLISSNPLHNFALIFSPTLSVIITMASKQPLSPRSQQGKRRSLLDAFPDLQIGSSSAPAGQQGDTPEGKGSFGCGWPPMSDSMRKKLLDTQSGLVCYLGTAFLCFWY